MRSHENITIHTRYTHSQQQSYIHSLNKTTSQQHGGSGDGYPLFLLSPGVAALPLFIP